MIAEKYFPGFEERFIQTSEVVIHTLIGGQGKETLLLLHGHPETYLIWRDIAPKLAKRYRVVLTDLRGYGESSKPKGLEDHSNYSKRVMAMDQLEVLNRLSIDQVHLIGHDRGARVCHRFLLDHPHRVKSCTLMDILPTDDMYDDTNAEFATKYWHWFFYIQPFDFPERLLGAEPEFFIRYNLQRKVNPKAAWRFPEDVLAEYIRHYAKPETVHGISEDYRASASIDRLHNDVDRHVKIDIPLLIMWGQDGVVGKLWDVADGWKKYATQVKAFGVPECGHFVPEEQPEFVLRELEQFLEETCRLGCKKKENSVQ